MRRGRAILASIASPVMIALLPGSARATAGDLDLKFGGDGRVITNVTSGYDGANDVAIQTNGKIVAVGSTYYWRTGTRLAMVRYRPNGTLDPTFSGNGEVIAGFMIDASDVAIQTDGKIVVVRADGTSFVVARYRRDGSLDPTFGTGGKVMTSVSDSAASNAAVALQADWATPVDRCVRLRPDQRWVRVPPLNNSNPRFFPGALAIGGGGLIIVGSFLPWITATLPLIGTISRNGVDGGGDGVISLGLGIVVAVLGLAFLSASGLKRPDVLVGIGGGLALVGDLRGRRGRDTRCDRLRTDVARRTHPAAASGAADITASDAELGG